MLNLYSTGTAPVLEMPGQPRPIALGGTMRKLSVALVFSLSSPALLAQDLLSCLHPDVLQGLARSGITGVGDAVVTRTLPEAMDGIDAPPNFELIASSVGARETTVAFKADQSTPEAHEAALSALEADGWEVQGGERAPVYYEGSPTSPVPSVMTMLCLDGRNLSVGSRFIEGTSYVNFHIRDAQGGGVCAGPSGLLASARSIGALRTQGDLDQFMPALRFPPDPATGNEIVARPMGSSSGSASRSNTAQVSIAMPHGQLAEFLGAQLGAAGWTADSSWSGALTAGSTWTRAPEPERELIATVEVAARTAAVYEVTFRITDLSQ